jgi:hypothetical protein
MRTKAKESVLMASHLSMHFVGMSIPNSGQNVETGLKWRSSFMFKTNHQGDSKTQDPLRINNFQPTHSRSREILP